MVGESSSPLSFRQKRTVGEELYLVHLRRSNPKDNDDRDVETFSEKERVRSLGDELFSVHLKRSEGSDSNYDTIGVDDGVAEITDESSGSDTDRYGSDTSDRKETSPC